MSQKIQDKIATYGNFIRMHSEYSHFHNTNGIEDGTKPMKLDVFAISYNLDDSFDYLIETENQPTLTLKTYAGACEDGKGIFEFEFMSDNEGVYWKEKIKNLSASKSNLLNGKFKIWDEKGHAFHIKCERLVDDFESDYSDSDSSYFDY